MAIVLTNGKYYIARNSKGKMIKVSDIGQAKDFRFVENAIKQKNLAPSKCAGFYYIDTSIDPTICQDSDTGGNFSVGIDFHYFKREKFYV